MDNNTKIKLSLIPTKERELNTGSTLFKEKTRKLKIISNKLTHILLSIFIAAIFIFPFYILLINSFKSNSQIAINKLNVPSQLFPENYTNALAKIGFLSAAFNSLIITIVSNVSIVLVSAGGAWMMVKTRSKIGKAIYTLFIFSLIIPFQILMLPLVWWAEHIGLFGMTGLIIIYIGFGVPMTTFLLHGFVKGIPSSIEEAALVEGAGIFKIFFRLILPLLKPIIITVLILNTIWIWNDFLLPLLFTNNESDETIVLRIYKLRGTFGGADYSIMMASLLLALVPAMLFFLFAQKGIVSGITQGANK